MSWRGWGCRSPFVPDSEPSASGAGLTGRAFGAVLGVPFRAGPAHVMALGPVTVAGALEQAVPPRHEQIEAAEQGHEGGCRGDHGDLNAACRGRKRTRPRR